MNSTDAVKNFFGLVKMPFSKLIGVNELYRSSSFQEACARLQIGLENEDVVLLSGAVGSGKSNVLRYFTHNLDSNAYRSIYIAADSFKIGEIAKRALTALNVEVPYNGSAALRKLQQTIIKINREKAIKPLLIVDEIQELPTSTLVSLKNLLNYNMDSEIYLFLILCGQNSIYEKLRLPPQLEALSRRIRIRYALRPLSVEETGHYISHQMKVCGVEQSVFSDDSKAAIFQHSKGTISEINAICFELLIYATAQSKQIIEPSMLEVILQNRRGVPQHHE
ncbi:MAG: AAA family ATPase [Planctomycetes bacterium]|nr:AAA family ATPase [Planctomycetota bacterium]